MDVWAPQLGYFAGIPLTGGPAPSPNETYVPPGRKYLTALVESQSSTEEPVKAEVVDIDAQVANLDLSVTQEEDKVVLAADILFAFDKAKLTKKARSRIAQAAQWRVPDRSWKQEEVPPRALQQGMPVQHVGR